MEKRALKKILADDQAVRRAKLRQFAEEVASAKEELYAALTADLNRNADETLLAELVPLLDITRYLARELPRLLKPRRLPWSIATFPAGARLVREPYGRVLVISTWNYPLLLALEPTLGAYAAGNRVVLKLHPRSPHTNAFILRVLETVFSTDEILPVGGELTLTETLTFRYDYIFMTGNTATGQSVLRAAAEHCTPVTLELGGQNPCIVAENADLPVAARRIVWGKFFNAGQSCAAPDHLLVHRDVKDELMNLLCAEIRRMYGEHPLDGGNFPAMPDAAAYERVCALASGGRLICGGDRDPEKLAFEPTVIDRIDPESPLLTGEVFAPLLPVLEYTNETELLQRLQTREKPLALYCFGGSSEFRKRLTREISAGAVVFNDVMIHFSNMHIPFGGVGASGFGAYHGARTFTTFTHEKPVVRQCARFDLPFRYPPHSRFFRKLVEWFKHVR